MTTNTKKKNAKKPKIIESTALTLDSLVQDDHLYNELATVTFPDGRFTHVYKKFRSTKIDEMLEQFGIFIDDYTNKVGELKEEQVQNYLNLHILIAFSTLSNSLPELFEERVLLFEKLLDSKLAETVFESFDLNEIKEVYERMTKKVNSYVDVLNKDQETRDKVIEYVEKSDMKNKNIILKTIFNTTSSGDDESGKTV